MPSPRPGSSRDVPPPRGAPPVRILSDQAPAPDEDGLVVEVALLGPKDQARRLRSGSPETSWGFTRHPSLLTDRALANPLYADHLKATVRNASGGPLKLANARGGAREAFRVETRVEDAQGRPVPFPGLGESGLKWLGMKRPGEPTATIEPGGRVALAASIWPGLAPSAVPPPGTYTARVVVSFIRDSDGAARRVESAPIIVVVTAEDVADFGAGFLPLQADLPGYLDAFILVLGL